MQSVLKDIELQYIHVLKQMLLILCFIYFSVNLVCLPSSRVTGYRYSTTISVTEKYIGVNIEIHIYSMWIWQYIFISSCLQ